MKGNFFSTKAFLGVVLATSWVESLRVLVLVTTSAWSSIYTNMLSRGIRSLASKVPARLKSNLLKRESFKTEEDFKKVQELLNYPSDFQTKVKQLIPDSEWDYKNQGKDWGDLCPIGNEQSPTSLHCQALAHSFVSVARNGVCYFMTHYYRYAFFIFRDG